MYLLIDPNSNSSKFDLNSKKFEFSFIEFSYVIQLKEI